MKRVNILFEFIALCMLVLIGSCNLLSPNTVDDPVITPPEGIYNQAQMISLVCGTEGSEIRYTVDGSIPPENSYVYSSPFVAPLGTTVKAIASKADWKTSKVVSAFYSGLTPEPIVNLESGSYNAGTIAHISINAEGLSYNYIKIRYTLDGSEPDSTSQIYLNDVGVVLTESCTLKARTYYKNWIPSSSVSADYVISTPTVQTPSITPPSGTVDILTQINIACGTYGATIHYTSNGDDPTPNSPVYSNPLTIITGGNVIIKAMAIKPYTYDSDIATASYTVHVPTVATPVISPSSGNVNIGSTVIINCPTPNSTIHYTTNGQEPTENSPEYSIPLKLVSTGNVTIKAKAYRQYWNPSVTCMVNYIVIPAPLEMVYVTEGSFFNGTSVITLSGFNISKYEVTQFEYQATVNSNPSNFSGYDLPVESISWCDCILFCNKRSILEGLTPCYSYGSSGTNPDNWPSSWQYDDNSHENIVCNWNANGYRLPTEMEWMFAAMGGVNSNGYEYSGSYNIHSVAWFSFNSGGTTHIVGTKDANELGCHDMSGNVREWVWDRNQSTYPPGDQTDPHGYDYGWQRVIRNGGWSAEANHCTIDYRGGMSCIGTSIAIGFRVCRNAN